MDTKNNISTDNKKAGIGSFIKNTDLAFTFGLLGIVMLLVMPVAPALIDILLAFSIAISLVIMLIVIYVKDPAEFSTFPTILLAVTLYRLGLNVASTRLILLDAYAGEIINSFGNFVIRGNYVVGSVVFLILIVINFIVITKGAGRIAEVAARFTLDAMPGKQMAIDAELNAGIIDEAVATIRRHKIQKEADFYGAMDGASKFVRGDAIAGILITFINIVGGFAIGVFQKDMPVFESLETYTLLSIGDGLISQIPALIISVGAGILVTRSDEGMDLSRHFSKQLIFYPKAIGIAAIMMLVFAVLPGFPLTPFLLLALALGWIARILHKRSQSPEFRKSFDSVLDTVSGHEKDKKESIATIKPGSTEELQKMIQIERFSVELGYGLLGLVDSSHGGDLLERITGVRQKFAKDMGMIIPPISVRDNLELENHQYRFLIKNKELARGNIMPNHYLAMNVTNSEVVLEGIPTIEPVFGLEAVWVEEAQKQIAQTNGYTVVESSSVMITHLSEILKDNAHYLLEREDTQKLIEVIKEKNPTLVNELLPDLVSVGIIQRVLQNLLSEKIPIKNLSMILEKIADYAPVSKNPDELSEYVRRHLGAFFVNMFEAKPGIVQALTLDPTLEQVLINRIKKTQFEVGLLMDPHITKNILEELAPRLNTMIEKGLEPLLITTIELRLPFKRFFEPSFSKMHVIAYQELPKQTHVQSVGVISIDINAVKPSLQTV